MNDEISALKSLRTFLRWVKIKYPHIIKEYLEDMKAGIKELDKLAKERDKNELENI